MCNGGHDPLKDKKPPSEDRISGTDGGQYENRVGSRNQKIDGAVINDLHDLFRHFSLQPVIYAGHGVERNQGYAINCRADHAVEISVPCGVHQTQN